jgi:hypothetical protein
LQVEGSFISTWDTSIIPLTHSLLSALLWIKVIWFSISSLTVKWREASGDIEGFEHDNSYINYGALRKYISNYLHCSHWYERLTVVTHIWIRNNKVSVKWLNLLFPYKTSPLSLVHRGVCIALVYAVGKLCVWYNMSWSCDGLLTNMSLFLGKH